ncbi:hypothetical protein [Streptomyces sp. NPDC046939]|uniref:hypothetical protein n=1 Tax=Streptomyces sp. NPDC046939 TaxID=3155376 RepID=UPI0034040B81
MKELRFWAAIDELEGCADEATVHELRELLLGEEKTEVAAFQELLKGYVCDVRRRADEAGAPLTEAEASAVVAADRSIYLRILDNPAAYRTRAWDVEEAHLLLEAARDVLDFAERLPDSEPDSEPDSATEVRPGWLTVRFDSDITIPPVYERAVEHLAESIDASATWRGWWAAADSPCLFVTLKVMHASEHREPPRLRRVHDLVELGIDVAPQRIRRLRLPGRAARATDVARDDVRTCFESVAEQLGLGPIPALPSDEQPTAT